MVTIFQMNEAIKATDVKGGHFNNSGMVEFTSTTDKPAPAPLPLRSLYYMTAPDCIAYVTNNEGNKQWNLSIK